MTTQPPAAGTDHTVEIEYSTDHGVTWTLACHVDAWRGRSPAAQGEVIAEIIRQAEIRYAAWMGSNPTLTLTRVRVTGDDAWTGGTLSDLRAAVAQAHADDASSNDLVQIVDDFFVASGLGTVIYR